MKKCKACLENLSLDKFAEADGNKEGLSNICRKCHSKRVLDYYYKNKEKRLAYQKDYYYKLRGDKVVARAVVVPGKACASCKAVGGSYTKDRSAKDGRNRQCTLCVNAKSKARRNARKANGPS